MGLRKLVEYIGGWRLVVSSIRFFVTSSLQKGESDVAGWLRLAFSDVVNRYVLG
jgi:hypothetical protein